MILEKETTNEDVRNQDSPSRVTRFHMSHSRPIAGEVWEALKQGEIGWGKALSQHKKEPTLEEVLMGWNEYLESKKNEEELSESGAAILIQIIPLVAQVVGE